jgi:hypothetical protein
MELIEGFETSANHNLTTGKYPKEYIRPLTCYGHSCDCLQDGKCKNTNIFIACPDDRTIKIIQFWFKFG